MYFSAIHIIINKISPARESGAVETGRAQTKEGMIMYIADLHIHSRYSRATSKDCTPEHLDLWARRKGIHIVGTGDFTHPAWREELKEKLKPAEDGLYVLKDEYRIEDETVRGSMTPRFVVTGEISSIYKKGGRVRKVHSLILLPGLEAAEEIAGRLEEIGNIHSDGRPILGLSCHDLLEILLTSCPESIYVPAHIWTPHFSLFGAFSGFDTVEECFEDLTPYIHAVETGLSSDPPMNWRVSALDRYHLISNSDAHSPAKLGREANLLDIEMSYEGLCRAIQDGTGLQGTIEFFPEEGKYHLDGHRKCGLCLTPSETEKYGGVCPVCGRKITIGVSHRVEELADRPEDYVRTDGAAFESLVPLPEVIGASLGHSSVSRKVLREYEEMLGKLGPEFEILRTIPQEDIQKAAGHRIAQGIMRLRQGKVERIPGFDGEYGTIRLFTADELENTDGQMDFFSLIGVEPEALEKGQREAQPVLSEKEPVSALKEEQTERQEVTAGGAPSLNPEQREAVRRICRHLAVVAGPGTGKTKTLVSRIQYLLEHRKVKPSEITAVTFTNQAAGEMRERLKKELGSRRVSGLQIGTFHSICLHFLRKAGVEFFLASEAQCRQMAGEAVSEAGLSVGAGKFLESLSRKQAGLSVYEEERFRQAEELYKKKKQEMRLLDFDDLLLETLRLLEGGAPAGKQFTCLLIDEFQDIDPLQYRLVRAWDRDARELFVIGDPNQSIYGFRGADAGCFERLRADVEAAGGEFCLVELRENYRSTPQILEAARRTQGCEPLHPNCPEGAPVRLLRAGSELGEAIFIAKEIGRMAGGIGMLEAQELSGSKERQTRSFDEIAVLARTHRQADLVEMCLRKEGIPYIVAGREGFLEDDKVQGSICFFQYLENPENESAAQMAAELLLGLSWNQLTEEMIRAMAEKYRPLFEKKKPGKFLEMWMEEQGLQKEDAVKKLAAMTVFYKTMPDFLRDLVLGVESDLKRCGGKNYTSGAVTLMTLHGSKGLEFPAVFIYGAREGNIPLENEKRPSDEEEERRLLYVGMTRAKEELILTCSGEESRFLAELPETVLKREKEIPVKKEETCHQMSLFELEN